MEKELEQLKNDLLEALDALELMWKQYCPPPMFHKFMSAGEKAEQVLQKHNREIESF